jgi:hypothetical protein
MLKADAGFLVTVAVVTMAVIAVLAVGLFYFKKHKHNLIKKPY